jgi:hypothetical protein
LAGYKEVSEKFGIELTIAELAQGQMSEEDKILDMPIIRVYRAIQRKAWIANAEKRYANLK